MMSTKKYFAIITDVGQSKIAEAVAGGQKLNITTFLVGDGNGEYYVPTSDMTAIKNEVWRGTISKADVVQDAQKILRITTVIPAEVSGFIVREIALLDETEELVAIGNTPDLPKVRLEDGASTELKLTMRLAVKNTEALSFTIDPHTVIMTKDMLDTHNVDSNAHNELFEGKADKEHQHSTDDITSGTLSIARGGTGNTTGNAATATKLQTARTIRTNLASTSTASFDGTSDITPGVTGTLPIANGGTGNTTGNAATATKLQTARTIDGMPFDGSKNIVHFGVCNTAAATAAKTVALTGFTLTEGARVAVFFTNTNTANNLTLNVNSTGAKAISCIKGYYAPIGQWEANQIVEFVYYNNHWIMITANARRLYAARTIRTNLASTSTASFDGTANITPGVTGTLPITNGGTGATTASTALSNLGGFAKTGGTISGATTIQGNLTLKTASSNYGCKINFGDGDYVHISEPTDDNMEIKAKNVNFVVSGNITKNGAAFGGGSMTKTEIYNVLKPSGSENTAFGVNALGTGTSTGSFNTAFGGIALYQNSTGSRNTAIGYCSLKQNTSGYDNTAIGEEALFYLSNYYNCTGLGANSAVTGSNQVQLGNANVTVYAQKALVTRSDKRDKLDIEDSPLGLDFIMKLRPRKYRMNSREAYFEQGKERDFTATNDGSKAGKRPHYGLVAQEVKEVMNELNVDFAGYLDSKIDGGEDVLSLGYAEFIAPMIKAIQQQQHMIEQLQKEIELLKG
jgi:phage-related tail fiber protein